MGPRWFCKLFGRELGPLDFDELIESSAGGAAAARKRKLIWGSGIAVGVVAFLTLGIWLFFTISSAPWPGGSRAAAGTMEDVFSQDFREECLPHTFQLVSGPRPRRQFCKVEPSGLRFTLPAESKTSSFAASPRIVLKGDFEITAGYTILALPRPRKGFGAGLRIVIEDPEGERAAVQRLLREREGHVVSSYRARRQDDDTYEHSVRILPITDADTTSGSLRLRRNGANVEFWVAGAGETEFTQIHTEEFPPGDVAQPRLEIQTGGSPTAVDVAWTTLDVRADELTRVYQPPQKSRFWQRLLLVLLAAGLIAAGCLAVWLWLARRAYLHPNEPNLGPQTN